MLKLSHYYNDKIPVRLNALITGKNYRFPVSSVSYHRIQTFPQIRPFPGGGGGVFLVDLKKNGDFYLIKKN